MLELRSDNQQDLKQQADKLIKDLKDNKLGYHFPIVSNNQIKQVNELRKAGLGALANIKGNKKAVACIEDTAVRLGLTSIHCRCHRSFGTAQTKKVFTMPMPEREKFTSGQYLI